MNKTFIPGTSNTVFVPKVRTLRTLSCTSYSTDLAELNKEELEQVRGGYWIDEDGHVLEFGVPSSQYCPKCGNQMMCIYDCTTCKEVDFIFEVCS